MPHTPSEHSRFEGHPLRVVIIPGLNDSGPGHWQTWLQSQYRGAARVKQSAWDRPDLSTWSAQIDRVVNKSAPGTRWVAVAHSFGSLALAHHLSNRSSNASSAICSALIVAPANPAKFGLDTVLPRRGLGIPAQVVGSENDPWMPLDVAREWAEHWGARFHNLGQAGHINVESGHGPWPWVRFKVDQLVRDQQRERRLERAHPMELSYAV
jgi:uncharacterized protein